MKIFLFFYLLLILSKKKINSGKIQCFEYSCAECESQEYGKCTKCKSGWTLTNGTCPCVDSSCALCSSGLAGLHLCILCKNGYYKFENDCYCQIKNCELCGEKGCVKCIRGYFYNITSKQCEEEKDINLTCYDNNCDSCFSEEKGACELCREGFTEKKGECLELPTLDENLTCPEGYYKSGNFCIETCGGVDCPDIYHPPYYYSCPSNKCLICIDKVLRIWSDCDNSEECSLMEGCLNCITNNECIVCQQGYYLLGGLCIKCLDGCSSCTNNETCDYCMSGYELNSEGLCNYTNNFDFDFNIYQNYKEFILFFEEITKIEEPTNKPTEKPSTDKPSIDIPTTDKPSTDKPSTEMTEIISQETSIPTQSIIVPTTLPATTINVNIVNPPNDIEGAEDEADLDLNDLMECDKNCIKCYDNLGKCIECAKLYILQENKCIKKCTDEKCLDCSLQNEEEFCNKCAKGYKPNGEECSLICSDNYCSKCSIIKNKEYCNQCRGGFRLKNEKCVVKCYDDYCEDCSDNGRNCTKCEIGKKLIDGKCALQSNMCSEYFQFCNYCFGSERCVECLKGYKLDETEKNCIKDSSYISVIFSILGIGIIIVGIISYCVYQKRKRELRYEMRRMRHAQDQGNSVNVYRRNIDQLNVSGSSRSALSKEDLGDEFELQRKKTEKGNQTCQFCKKKPGKFKCDCGCIVCKDHSKLKRQEGDGETYNVCFACSKIVKKVTAIKYPCHICFMNKLAVAHFKCGCALEVCKTCYIKCKMTNNKCPGCRAII